MNEGARERPALARYSSPRLLQDSPASSMRHHLFDACDYYATIIHIYMKLVYPIVNYRVTTARFSKPWSIACLGDFHNEALRIESEGSS